MADRFDEIWASWLAFEIADEELVEAQRAYRSADSAFVALRRAVKEESPETWDRFVAARKERSLDAALED